MPPKKNLVNLDAMIKREDFAKVEPSNNMFDSITSISIRDFTDGGLVGLSLRKPDFQRETNHWDPEQVASLIDCFINGELIPSVILWKAPSFIFVIDGGHRLSVLKAWVQDDYGDGPLSQAFFGNEISQQQLKAAEHTRSRVDSSVGSWAQFQAMSALPNHSQEEQIRITTIWTRALPLQWVKGDVNKAENSFFRINKKGTPLDEIEELLLKSRNKPISIAARAIIRAGKGHRYWSEFANPVTSEIETLSKNIHQTLFNPEVQSKIRTLDLPLGGAKGVRTALKVLMD